MRNAIPTLALAVLALMAGTSPPEPTLSAHQPNIAAAYEQQVEEGFGRLDQLPIN